MTLSPLARPLSVADRLSDMVAWDAVPPTARVAVIDIGSNSVRLVIYGKNGAYPSPLFDERSNCQLGAGLESTGEIATDRIADALTKIARFAEVIRAMQVDTVYPVATAAVRRASNCEAFKIPAEDFRPANSTAVTARRSNLCVAGVDTEYSQSQRACG